MKVSKAYALNHISGRLSVARSFILCVIIYSLVTAPGILLSGNNSDDWRDLSGAPAKWLEIEGRWAMDFIYRYLLFEQPQLIFQAILAFICYYLTSLMLTKYCVTKDRVGLFTVVVFTCSIHHIYLLGGLQFNSHVFAWPFAMLLSVISVRILLSQKPADGISRRILLIACSSVSLSVAIGIYPSFAIVGTSIPFLLLIRHNDRSIRYHMYNFGLVVLAGICALLLHVAFIEIAFSISGRELDFIRFEKPTISQLKEKLLDLPLIQKRYLSGGIVRMPFGMRIVYALFSALAILSVLCGARIAFIEGVRVGKAEAVMRSAKVGLGGLFLLCVFPLLFWLTYVGGNLPGRAVGYAGLFTALVISASLHISRDAVSPPSQNMWEAVFVWSKISISLVFMMAAATVWSDIKAAGERDLKTANAIFDRVSELDEFDSGPLNIAGYVHYADLAWGHSIGRSVFYENNEAHRIFSETFGLKHAAISLPLSPVACPAFPAKGSVFRRDQQTYVCLNAFPDMEPLSNCQDTGAPAHIRVCSSNNFVIQVFEKCEINLDRNRILYISTIDETGTERVARFPPVLPYFRYREDCYRAARQPSKISKIIALREHIRQEGIAWVREF